MTLLDQINGSSSKDELEDLADENENLEKLRVIDSDQANKNREAIHERMKLLLGQSQLEDAA